MTIFKFLKQFYEVRQLEYDWYNDIYQVILNCSSSNPLKSNAQYYREQRDNYKYQKKEVNLKTYPRGIIDSFTHYYPIEWLKDGISKETMDKYDIRFSHTFNKIIIPHFNANGELVGIRGRALNPEEVENVGKYIPVWIEGKCYNHQLGLNLYGLNLVKENIQSTGIAFIAEGEKSCLQANSFQMKNCVCAACGSNINKFQINLLMKLCQPKEIVICFDNEEKPQQDLYFQKLYKTCKKYNKYVNMSFIYDRSRITKSKDSPFDNGEEVFKELLKTRVKVK